MHREQSGVKTLKFSCFGKASEDHFLVGRTRNVTSKSQIEKKKKRENRMYAGLFGLNVFFTMDKPSGLCKHGSCGLNYP